MRIQKWGRPTLSLAQRTQTDTMLIWKFSPWLPLEIPLLKEDLCRLSDTTYLTTWKQSCFLLTSQWLFQTLSLHEKSLFEVLPCLLSFAQYFPAIFSSPSKTSVAPTQGSILGLHLKNHKVNHHVLWSSSPVLPVYVSDHFHHDRSFFSSGPSVH